MWVPAWNPFSFFAIFAVGALACGALALLAPDGSAVGRTKAAFALYAAVLLPWGVLDAASGGFGDMPLPYHFPWSPLAAALVLVFLPALRSIGWLIEHRFVRATAALSFGIYLWHVLVIESLRRLAEPVAATVQFLPWLLLCGTAAAVTVLVAKLSFVCLERPAIQIARRFERRRIRQPAA